MKDTVTCHQGFFPTTRFVIDVLTYLYFLFLPFWFDVSFWENILSLSVSTAQRRVHETVHHYYKFEKMRYYKTCLTSGGTSRDRPMSGPAQEHCVCGGAHAQPTITHLGTAHHQTVTVCECVCLISSVGVYCCHHGVMFQVQLWTERSGLHLFLPTYQIH